MKSRDIQGKMFLDPYYQSLSMKEKIGWTYLVFNEHINWLGCQELTERTALFEMGCDEISSDDFKAMKVKFDTDGKIYWLGNWYLIKNSDKYSNHLTNIQIMGTAYDQFMSMPEEVQAFFYQKKPTPIAAKYQEMFAAVLKRRNDEKFAKEEKAQKSLTQLPETESKKSGSSQLSNLLSSLPTNLDTHLPSSSSNKTQDTRDMNEVGRESEGGEGKIARESSPDYLENLDFIAYLQAEYPHVDVRSELRKMQLDLTANGKTKSNYRAWAEKWIFAEEEKARKKVSTGQKSVPKRQTPTIEQSPPEPRKPRKVQDIVTAAEARQKLKGWIIADRIDQHHKDVEYLAKKFGLNVVDLGYPATPSKKRSSFQEGGENGQQVISYLSENTTVLDPL